MIIGIDVGGTHTDGVLVKKEKVKSDLKYKIADTSKISTNQSNLKNSILSVFDNLIQNENNSDIERIVLSTTLATNIIQEEKYDPVGLILIPGPGLNPEYLMYGEENIILSGYIDHRGKEIKSLDEEEIIKGLDKLKAEGIKKIAVVGKFSIRNPIQEKKVKEIIDQENYDFQTVTLGHKLSGNLNFTRRIITAYFNTAVNSIHKNFIKAIENSLQERNIKADIYLLKCDGGTISLNQSLKTPVKTVNSGPAASIMGTMVLSENEETGVVLDIGGTTTDIGLIINGEPAFMPKGIEINGYPTLVRGLYTVSIPLGGDSEIHVEDDKLKIGPQRRGVAAALGGDVPTPTDALLVLGYINEKEKIERGFDTAKAKQALRSLKNKIDLSLYSEYISKSKKISNTEFDNKSKYNVKIIAEIIIQKMAEKIEKSIFNILQNLRNQPVYTISELLENPDINPRFMIGMGGPASSLVNIIAQKLNYRPEVPPYSKVANAIGVAFSHPTIETTVRADTATGQLDIVEAGIHRQIQDNDFDLDKAEDMARIWTKKRFESDKYPIEITERENFNVIRNFRTLGEIMKVKAQIKPGHIARVKGGNIIL